MLALSTSLYYVFTVVDCGVIGAPENGEITLNGTTFDSEATYECDEGFELVGNVTRTCEATGNWSGEEPVCERKTVNKAYCIVSYLYTL